jgi:hypothetical protein
MHQVVISRELVFNHSFKPTPWRGLIQTLGMSRTRTAIEVSAGQLILAIDKEWHSELGTSAAEASEDVVGRAHELLQAAKSNSILSSLGGLSIAEFLGPCWVSDHPRVQPAIETLEALLVDRQHA